MLPRLFSLLAPWVALATLLTSAAAQEGVDPSEDKRVRVLLLGDSISMGYHNTVVAELGEDYHVVRPMNASGNGFENCAGTTKGVAELERWLALDGGHWDVIHFNWGLHDLKRVHPETGRNSTDPNHPRQAELDVYVKQLTQIVDRLEREGAKLIFATTTPVPEGVRPYRENADVVKYNFAAEELMWLRGIERNDLYSKTVNDLDVFQNPRDVHFKKEGSVFLGQKVADVIRAKMEPIRRVKQTPELWRVNREVLIQELEAALAPGMPGEERVGRSRPARTPSDPGFNSQRTLLEAMEPASEVLGHPGGGSQGAPTGSAQEVRILQRDGYSITHLLIDSRPGMRIPAHLYLPDPQRFKPPWAGVLVPCGHTYEGKSHPDYQRGGMHLARHGMAALVFDPLDQGERIQAPKDDDSRQQHWGTTSHNIVGGQARLLGWSQAGLELWDSVRCVDYLVSREDIDADRLGVCGQSGGGTQTSQVFAVDKRLKAAAPACYITSLGALARTIGPQDEEQNLWGQARHGLDHGSYLLARAPAPFLICAAEDDFFSIEGTRETYERVKAVYATYGKEENAQLVVSPGGHNWGEVLVSATVEFMAKHLDGREIEVAWSDEIPMTLEEAQVTPQGHVVWMEGEQTIYDVLGERAKTLKESRTRKMDEWLEGAGDREFERMLIIEGHVRDLVMGRKRHSWNRRLERLDLDSQPGVRDRHLLVDQDGFVMMVAKDEREENEEGDPAPAWVVLGAGAATAKRPADAPGTVYFLDVICTGGLTPTDRPWYGSFGPAGTDGAYGVLSGEPLLARQVAQILDFALMHPGEERLVATGLPALAAAHAYAMDRELFTEEHAINLPFESWEDLLGYGSYRDALAFVVPNALTYYDLPDLLRTSD